jgi:hypothetical protein
MTSDMMGSSPVVGSSKKMISGSRAIARAKDTRFCMPPDNSEGCSSPTSAFSPTAASLVSAIFLASTRAMPSAWIGPKATFSHTGSESNSAPP